MKSVAILLAAVFAPVSGVLSTLNTAEILTCGTNTDCFVGTTSNAEECLANLKCKVEANICEHFVLNSNSFPRCRKASEDGNTVVTLYQSLKTTGQNCDLAKSEEFKNKIKNDATLLKDITHTTVVLCANNIRRTSIKVDVKLQDLLGTDARYRDLGRNIESAVDSDANLKDAIGTFDRLNAGLSEGLKGACSLSAGESLRVPFGNPLSTTVADRECRVVECQSGYSFDAADATACRGPGQVQTDTITTCGTTSDCQGCTNQFVCGCDLSANGNTIKSCGTLNDRISLHYVLTHGAMIGDSSKQVDCTKILEFETPLIELIKSVEQTAKAVVICNNNKLSSVVTLSADRISDVLAASSRFIQLALNVNQKLIEGTNTRLKAAGAVINAHVGTDLSFHHLCPNIVVTSLRAPLSYENHLHATSDRECATVNCATDYELTSSGICSFKVSALTPSEIVTCGSTTDCGVSDVRCNNYQCSSTSTATCNHYASNGKTFALCNSATVVTDQTTTLLFVLNHRSLLPTKIVDCSKFDESAYDTLLRSDSVLKGKVTDAEFATLETFHNCVTTGTRQELKTVVKIEARINNLLTATVYTNLGANINTALAISTDDKLKPVGEVFTSFAGTEEAFNSLCPLGGGQSISVPFSSENYKSADVNFRDCKAIKCISGFSLVSPNCLPAGNDSPRDPIVNGDTDISFDVTGELATIGKQSDKFVQSTNTALATSDARCREICLLSGFGCLTCDAAKALIREPTTLAVNRYKVKLSATTVKSAVDAINDLRTTLRALFVSLASQSVILTLHEDSITITADPASDDDGLSGGAIAGIVVGCAVFMVIVVVMIFCFCFKGVPYDDTSESGAEKTNPDQV